MWNFRKYAAYYDLLYRDKNYVAEADYVARTIRAAAPDARRVLEFGSGTGRHGRLLAGLGFDVLGIERSPEMVVQSEVVAPEGGGAGSFSSQVGDICALDLGRRFDAVIALFHVIGYQTSNAALRAAFESAYNHLEPGGIFLFDVWHGPAVLTEQPERRVKEVSNAHHRVKRTARPELDTNRSTVKVVYDLECTDIASGTVARFSEEHLMRYLFATEISLLAEDSGMEVVLSEAFLSAAAPSESSWSVTYILRRSAPGTHLGLSQIAAESQS